MTTYIHRRLGGIRRAKKMNLRKSLSSGNPPMMYVDEKYNNKTINNHKYFGLQDDGARNRNGRRLLFFFSQ